MVSVSLNIVSTVRILFIAVFFVIGTFLFHTIPQIEVTNVYVHIKDEITPDYLLSNKIKGRVMMTENITYCCYHYVKIINRSEDVTQDLMFTIYK